MAVMTACPPQCPYRAALEASMGAAPILGGRDAPTLLMVTPVVLRMLAELVDGGAADVSYI